jgi:hypothetical protein
MWGHVGTNPTCTISQDHPSVNFQLPRQVKSTSLLFRLLGILWWINDAVSIAWLDYLRVDIDLESKAIRHFFSIIQGINRYASTMVFYRSNMSALPCAMLFSWDGHQELANPIENLVDVWKLVWCELAEVHNVLHKTVGTICENMVPPWTWDKRTIFLWHLKIKRWSFTPHMFGSSSRRKTLRQLSCSKRSNHQKKIGKIRKVESYQIQRQLLANVTLW